MKTVAQLRNFAGYARELGWVAASDIVRWHRSRRALGNIRLPGLRTPLICRANNSDFPVLRQVWGRAENTIPLENPHCIVDAGANVGFTSVRYAHQYPDAVVIALEPDLGNFALLVRNCLAYPNVRPVWGAIWPTDGLGSIRDPSANADSLQVTTARDVDGVPFPCYRLWTLLNRFGLSRVDLLKIDIEGSERELFLHPDRSWLDHVHFIAVELHEGIAPGATAAFHSAISGRDDAKWRQGEYDVVRLRPTTVAVRNPQAPYLSVARHLPTVSVVIPCHNAQRWLPTALTSSLACEGVTEVIVADDGSTDRTVQIAESFGPRVHVLRGSKRGGNAARNAGLHFAKSEWVQFLDADDYLEPSKIALQFAEAGGGRNADVLYSPVIIETGAECVVDRQASPLDATTDVWTQWISWQFPQTGGPLWRKSRLLKLGGWREDQPCCQEHELYLRALKNDLRFELCPTPGAVYRIWSEETVCRRDPVHVIRVRTSLIDDALSWLNHHDRLQPAHREAAAVACFEMARTWAKIDVKSAESYYNERLLRGLILPRGPAAPTSYRLAHRIAGFRKAESIAAGLRTLRPAVAVPRQ